jgi:hypothetical protein
MIMFMICTFLLSCNLHVMAELASEIELHVSYDAELTKQQEEAICMLIILHGNHPDLCSLAEAVRKDLEATEQIVIKIHYDEEPRRKHEISQRFDEGNPFVLYLTMYGDEAEVHGRLYNTLDVVMLRGKRWKKRPSLTLWAHHIADDVWRELMGGPSSFLSSIVYVTKEEKGATGIRSNLVIAQWDGSEPQVVLSRKTHILAPAWLPCRYGETPELVFSEFTHVNVRLMKVATAGPRQVKRVFDMSGTLVGVSAQNLDCIVYCRSGIIWQYTYDAATRRSIHEPVIEEAQPCACPIALSEGDILYCVEGHIKKWHKVDGTTETITSKGFCTSPAFHEGRKLLVFSRRVKGTFQLIVKDMETGCERPITTGAGHKIDPTFSPCGFWVAYTVEQGKKSSIYVVNLVTEGTREISSAFTYSMCPSWSLG